MMTPGTMSGSPELRGQVLGTRETPDLRKAQASRPRGAGGKEEGRADARHKVFPIHRREGLPSSPSA